MPIPKESNASLGKTNATVPLDAALLYELCKAAGKLDTISTSSENMQVIQCSIDIIDSLSPGAQQAIANKFFKKNSLSKADLARLLPNDTTGSISKNFHRKSDGLKIQIIFSRPPPVSAKLFQTILQSLSKWAASSKVSKNENLQPVSKIPPIQAIEPATEKEKLDGKALLRGGTWGKTFLALTHPAQAKEQLAQFKENAKKILNKAKLFKPEKSPTLNKTASEGASISIKKIKTK